MVLANCALPSLSVQHLGIAHLVFDADRHVACHVHPHVEILVMMHGTLCIHLNTEHLCIGTGDVIYYAPDLPHREHVAAGQTADFFCLACTPGIAPPVPVIQDTHGRIRLMAQWIYDEAKAVSASQCTVLDAFTGALLAELTNQTMHQSTNQLVLVVRTFLSEHLDEPLSVSDMAKQVQMSRAHFSRTYKRLTGLTPWDDLLRMRVEAARNLLITTQLPLRAIALHVGFSDEYHLSRVFRRYVQVSPGYYRQHGHVTGS